MITSSESKTSLSTFTVLERAVLYARVSGDDRKYATSGIEGQLSDCRKYAESKNYRVVGEYFELPEKYTSGADWLPELEKVLSLAETRAFDVLIVREIDRLARNRFKQMSIENQLESLGLRVEYVIGQFEDSSEGKLLKGVMSEFAEFERNKIKERTARGRIKAIKSGKIITGGAIAPYGYDLINNRLVINSYEAEIVKLIFDMYVYKRYAINGITEYLNEHGVPEAARGTIHKAQRNPTRPTWSHTTVAGILSNETYVGRWYYAKRRVVKNFLTGKPKYVRQSKEDWLMVEVPAIITEGIFRAAQERKEENKRLKGKNRKHKYLFGGMLRCGCCGTSASGVTQTRDGKSWGYYACNAHKAPQRYGFKCEDSRYFRVEAVDNTVWNWIKSVLIDEQHLDEALEQYQREQQEVQQPLLRLIEANREKLAKLEAQKARLIEGYTSGILTLDEIAPKKVDLDNQINKLYKAIKLMEDELPPVALRKEQIEEIHAFAAKIRQGLKVAEDKFEARRRIVELLKVQIVLSVIDGVKWAEVKCVLGSQQLETESTSTIQICW